MLPPLAVPPLALPTSCRARVALPTAPPASRELLVHFCLPWPVLHRVPQPLRHPQILWLATHRFRPFHMLRARHKRMLVWAPATVLLLLLLAPCLATPTQSGRQLVAPRFSQGKPPLRVTHPCLPLPQMPALWRPMTLQRRQSVRFWESLGVPLCRSQPIAVQRRWC